MEFNQQVEQLVNYFKQGETKQQQIGAEIEHFIIDKSNLEAVSYQQEKGIEDILYNLSRQDKWTAKKEGEHLIELSSAQANITLEPGGQFEIGTIPCLDLDGVKQIYDGFLQDVISILEDYDYYLTTLGYQIKSQIKDIPFNPKQRYKIMARYLQKTGKYAHHMMKGTASLQIALDYKSETDFVKKFRLTSCLSPILASLLDNSPIFEGEIYSQQALRTLIWNHTDPRRTGIVADSLTSDFGYRKYAEYILTREPILLKTDGEYIATGNQTCREIFKQRELGNEEIEHILTMVFPDVRAKQFIEVRMADSLPPKLMMAVIAFWKGLIYHQPSLDKAYEFSKQLKKEEVLNCRQKIIHQGLEAKLGTETIRCTAQQLVKWAKQGLTSEEQHYLNPLEDLLAAEETLAQRWKRRLKQQQPSEAVKECIINY